MKTKILFTALLGGIAFSACTNEELTVNTPAQDAPIFTLSVDEETRASIADDFTMTFGAGDLMSLYNGGATGYTNAIYEGSSDALGTMTFTTKSMVNPGLAVMVYPADTTFQCDPSAAPFIVLSMNQDAKTKYVTPFVSEYINVAAYSGHAEKQEAGYGRNYNIAMKRVGSNLRVTTEPENTAKIENATVADGSKVSPIKVTKMTLNSASQFADTVTIAKSATSPFSYNSDPKSPYNTWSNVADVTTTHSASAISTTDVTGNYTSIFTLLPQTGAPSVDGTSKVVLETNYGTLTVSGNNVWGKKVSGTVQYKDKDGAGNYTVDYALGKAINDMIKTTYDAETRATSLFKTEKVGGSYNRYLKADMSKIDMNGLHIKNSRHLEEVLAVYNAICPTATVTFYLDGNSNKQFVMTAAAREAYEKQVAKAGNNVTFTMCTTEICNTVVFENVATEAVEIPTVLTFGTSTPVEFTGAWKYTEADKKTTKNIESVTIVKGATLDVANEVNLKTSTASRDSLVNKGTINVTGTTYVKNWKVQNFGTIEIEAGEELRIKSTLTNDAEGLDDAKQGKIVNKGVLATVVADGGVINNYGTIDRRGGSSAKTYITNNQTTSPAADFTASWSATNKMGTIILADKNDDDYSVSNTGNTGFIQLYVNKATVAGSDLGVEANYIVLDNDVTNFDYTLAGTRIKYVEFKNASECVWTSAGGSTWTGVKVNSGVKVNIKKSNTVKTTKIFAQGTIYLGGALTIGGNDKGSYAATDFVTYWGGNSTKDPSNILAY